MRQLPRTAVAQAVPVVEQRRPDTGRDGHPGRAGAGADEATLRRREERVAGIGRPGRSEVTGALRQLAEHRVERLAIRGDDIERGDERRRLLEDRPGDAGLVDALEIDQGKRGGLATGGTRTLLVAVRRAGGHRPSHGIAEERAARPGGDRDRPGSGRDRQESPTAQATIRGLSRSGRRGRRLCRR